MTVEEMFAVKVATARMRALGRYALAGVLEVIIKGSGGSGNWAHTSQTRRGKGPGGSDPGGGWGAYVAGLNREFGEWSDSRTLDLADDLYLNLSKLTRMMISAQARISQPDTFTPEYIRGLAQSWSESPKGVVEIKQELARLQRLTHWDLANKSLKEGGDGKRIILMHGTADSPKAVQKWLPKTRNNLSLTTSVRTAQTFAGSPGRTIIVAQVPIGSIRITYRSARELHYRHPGEEEYVFRGGKVSNYALVHRDDTFIGFDPNAVLGAGGRK